jgi:hypothetical protein
VRSSICATGINNSAILLINARNYRVRFLNEAADNKRFKVIFMKNRLASLHPLQHP